MFIAQTQFYHHSNQPVYVRTACWRDFINGLKCTLSAKHVWDIITFQYFLPFSVLCLSFHCSSSHDKTYNHCMLNLCHEASFEKHSFCFHSHFMLFTYLFLVDTALCFPPAFPPSIDGQHFRFLSHHLHHFHFVWFFLSSFLSWFPAKCTRHSYCPLWDFLLRLYRSMHTPNAVGNFSVYLFAPHIIRSTPIVWCLSVAK